MALSSSIVVVNEFTTKQSSGKGSRGSTPGAYVTRYMARDLATEAVTPRTHQPETFITRYMVRESATEAAGLETAADVKKGLQQSMAPDAGVSFGYGRASLSSDELASASADIQRCFDEGKTVMKTVLSFDEEYLRKNKLIPEDFSLKNRGDYRGQLDQMKLRFAIMRGLERMSRHYDDLRYVGVIQVDTAHVHAHLAMVDAGVGKTVHGVAAHAPGSQRGKIFARDKSLLRRGIDSYLDEKQTVAHLSSAVGYERRNVSTYIKKWAYESMQQEADTQLLLASLPEDKSLWRAKSRRKEMKKPNAVAREMVVKKLQEKGSPWAQAIADIQRYAMERRKREKLSLEEWMKLVKQGREDALNAAINGMYDVLKNLPEHQVSLMTPMLDVMSADLENLAPREGVEDNLTDFAYRFRSYSARKRDHDSKREQMRVNINRFDEALERGEVSNDAHALRAYWLVEEEYHRKVGAKYRHFIRIKSDEEQLHEAVTKVQEYGAKVDSLKALRSDKSLMKYKNEQEARLRGHQIYGQYGGELMTTAQGRLLLDRRVERMEQRYDRMVSELEVVAESNGYAVERDGASVQLREGGAVDFEAYKGLDMHQMTRDFRQDERVGPRTAERFFDMTTRRTQALIGAMEYLDQSGQREHIETLAVADIMAMNEVATEVRTSLILRSELAPELAAQKRSKTVRLTERVAALVEREAQERLQEQVRQYLYEGVPEAQKDVQELE